MNKIIGFFEYANIHFVISLINDKNILFLKKNKSTCEFEKYLTKEEFFCCNTIFKSLLIDKEKSIFLKHINIHNNRYNLFYDKKSKKYFWIPENGKFEENDNAVLNFKYNHQPTVIYNNQINDNMELKNSFYNKFVKFGNKLINVVLLASLSLSSLTGCTVQQNIVPSQEKSSESSLVESVNVKETISYDWEDLKEVIKENPNLEEGDKEFIYKLKFVFDENYQYMDLDLVYDRLSDLKIIHNAKGIYLNAGGAYYPTENKIELYSQELDSFVHEFLHVLQESGGDFLKELSNEFFAREILLRLYNESLVEKSAFLSDYYLEEKENGNITFENEADWLYRISIGSGYQEHIGIYYVFADILPIEILRKYQFNPSEFDILIDALDNLALKNDETYTLGTGYKLLEMINDIGYNSYNGKSIGYYIGSESNQQLYETLGYYYRTIKGIDFKNSMFASMVLNNGNGRMQCGPIFDFMLEKYNINFSYYHAIMIPKTYLSEAQKNPLYVYGNADHTPNIFEADAKAFEEFYEFSLEKNKTLS